MMTRRLFMRAVAGGLAATGLARKAGAKEAGPPFVELPLEKFRSDDIVHRSYCSWVEVAEPMPCMVPGEPGQVWLILEDGTAGWGYPTFYSE